MEDIEQALILNCRERIINLERAILNAHPNDSHKLDALNSELSEQRKKLSERLSEK